MTSKEILEQEKENIGTIVLYSEGLFWKAYERSAYALVSQVKPFKPTRKVLKNLGGGDIVSVGFLQKDEQKYMGSLRCTERGEKIVRYECEKPVAEEDFTAWKSSLPIAEKPDVRLASPMPQVTDGTAQAAAACAASVCATTQAEATSAKILSLLLGFDLANSTPVECQLFLSNLKKLLKTN